ncbi:hypothetical protein TVAG_088590 [Trichomonas vaginalis G3]|uniref:Uncharacterized protein n=1 Tax=Trichomonas vaginalis (strain ATCC PRA-98 / G3) TaxID=412133 RepID=A2EB04_TRIV3|nr:hypothetical protein TVAGG3_0398060 [Trichomonas vaginalis G3]EAY10144.1 hypothetical protein TVAG_088590 [Trichomonas vaginalis G3]KAI5534481.1 hypothetical protein TVAGG3_0398060 [Trichomonas vaginalis G3]|eukprot:XP_001322367.1 hypothetical protein [Trichomonas vaginalis G3]
MSNDTQIFGDNAIINDQPIIKWVKETLNLPDEVNNIYFSQELNEEKKDKPIVKTLGGHVIERKGAIQIKTAEDDLISKYKFEFSNPDKTSAELTTSPDVAQILYIVFGYLSPEECNKIIFRSNDFQFSAYVSFTKRNDYSKQLMFGKISLRNITPEGPMPTDKPERKFFRAINETFKLDRIKNMYTFAQLALEYGYTLTDPLIDLDQSYNLPADVQDDLQTNLCRNEMDKIPSPESFTEFATEIAFPCAVFLIECLAMNQTQNEEGYLEKDFQQRKTVYNLLLPAILPVAFEANGQSVQVTFTNYMDIDAKQIHDRFMTVLNRTFKPYKDLTPMTTATFKQVLSGVYKQADVKKSNESKNYIILMTKQQKIGKFVSSSKDITSLRFEEKPATRSEGTTDFAIYMYPLSSSIKEIKEIKDQFEHDIEAVYNKIAYFECPECNCQSCHIVHSCPKGQHRGSRVAFKDPKTGEQVMERITQIEMDGEIKDIVQIEYDCCGKVNKDFDFGCVASYDHTMPEESDYDYHIWSDMNIQ